MSKLGPDVVSEEGLRELLGLGHQAMVVCVEAPRLKHNVWYGTWILRCVSLDGKADRLLVTFRRRVTDEIRPRTFQTLNGLVNFLHALGFRTLLIPMEEQARTCHNLAHHGAKAP